MSLIKYDDTMEIKEENIQDQQTNSESNKSTGRQDGGPYSCTTTKISSSNNSNAKTLIEYDIDETLDIKEEIVPDQERHQWGKHNFLSEINQLDEKCIANKIFSENNSAAKTLIEYDYGENFKIKEETVQDHRNIDQRINKKYESKLCTLDSKETGIMTAKEPRTSKKNIQVSKPKPKKKYNCEKCARSYAQKESLHRHKKLECDIIPEFSCESCGKWFKQKDHMNRHILRVHQKTDSKAFQRRHYCNKCSHSYSSSSTLNQHIRLEHAPVKPKFICDFCGFQANRKDNLSQHITSRHFQKNDVLISGSKIKYKCEKCARSYVQKYSLYKHKKFECDIMPQFGCTFCGKQFNYRCNMNRHILHVHQKTYSKTS